MDMRHQPAWLRWRRALATGELGVWDLRLDLETVHHSPHWKLRLGFPEPERADSTHFWRCRVHPSDLSAMMAGMREHIGGAQPRYEASFRLRSNGSGYRLVQSRGRVIERSTEGRAVRMVGTMLDLTDRPPTPQGGLPEGPRGPMEVAPLVLPFHRLLTDDGPEPMRLERDRVLALVDDLLHDTLAQLAALRTRPAG
ncbi:PAS domain-containing protein [Roseateles sp. LKC17W]|uniref:PAS domain-containing protein n=1 Tax=Pelomonas margarita TaxID=3299031 RepID=A0ABW7FEL2_9BURK